MLAGITLAMPAAAGPPEDAAARMELVGSPTGLTVLPSPIELSGARACRQVLVEGSYADGSVRDLTALCDLRVEPAGLADLDQGFLEARQAGSGVLVVRAGKQERRVPLTVKDIEKPSPVSFRREVIAAMNVGGCNMGACHGTPSGKNGFRLSLRGFDPAADYQQLTRDMLGRRTDRLTPGASLLLQKGLGQVPHEGGQRFLATSLPARTLHTWLAEGLRDDPGNLPPPDRLEVIPGPRVLRSPGRWQQLAVLAHFPDGSVRDVTRLTVFSSSDPAVAEVSATGLVEMLQVGEAAILCRYLETLSTVRLTYLAPRDIVWPNPPENNFVDRHVFAKLRLLGILPSDLCSDQEFLRRAFLDICGILPTPAESRAFLASKDPERREKLVDQLLQRPEYADFWTLKWLDVLRSSRKTIQPKGVHVFQQWLRGHIVRNTPFDEVVRDLLTASGSTFSRPAASYYRIARAPEDLAETTAQLFLGVRMQCARCHNHPFERWTQDDYYELAAFFSQVRHKKDPLQPGADARTPGSEVVFVARSGEVTQPRTGKVAPPSFPGEGPAKIEAGRDRRPALAAWLTSPENPFFARAVVNRVWFHLTGKGIVDPVDDFRDSNPSANDELLDALAKSFVESGYDLRKLVRTITTSRTYQLSAAVNDSNREDARYFSHALPRLLTAEQMLDAICAVTEVAEKFPGVPAGTRATQLPDGAADHPFLKTFGQPARELACECERESDSSLAQALQLINGPTVNGKLRHASNRIGRLVTAGKSDGELLEELYLAALSRLPTSEDAATALEHVSRAPDRRKAWEDVLWAVLNTREFLFRP